MNFSHFYPQPPPSSPSFSHWSHSFEQVNPPTLTHTFMSSIHVWPTEFNIQLSILASAGGYLVEQ